MSEIKNLRRQIDLNNLTYYLRVKSISPINFIGFKAALYLYRDIFSADIELAKAEEDRKKLKSELVEITRANPKERSKDKIEAIENIKNLYNSRLKIIKLFNDYTKIRSKAKYK